MPYVRISLMKPLEPYRTDIQRLEEDLLRYFKTQPGFIEGYLLWATDGTGRIGRLTVWEREEDADQAAQQPHTLAIRSEMRLRVEEESDLSSLLEEGFEATRV